MFVNSCLFKVCFVWILAFFFVSVCNMFLFYFLLEFNWILQRTHKLSFFAASSIVKKVFVTTCVREKKKKEKLGFRVFTSPFNRILVAQKLFRTEALSSSSFEMDRSLKLWMISPPSLLETALNSAYEDCVIPLPFSYPHLPLHY